MSLSTLPRASAAAPSPAAAPEAREVTWFFFGTTPAQPRVDDFGLQLAELVGDVRIAVLEPAPDDTTAFVEVDPPPDASIVGRVIVLVVPGQRGELTLELMPANPEARRRLADVDAASKPEPEELGVVARVVAIDDEPDGDEYRTLVRPLLCLLGELFPGGVATRGFEDRGFPTDGMRPKLDGPAPADARLDGELEVPATRGASVDAILLSNPWLLAATRRDGDQLAWRVATRVTPGQLRGIYRDMARLARIATAGKVRLLAGHLLDTTLHAIG